MTEAEVAALAESIYRSPHLNLPLSDPLDVDCYDDPRADALTTDTE